MGQLLETAESPWGRPALSMDWLAAWHDVATADNLFADGGGREVTPVPFFATSCSRGGARAASRFGSVAEICRRALAATLALTAGALPARAPRPCKRMPDAATRGLVTDGMALAVTRPATPADLQLAAGARRQWLTDRLWLYGQPAGVLVFDTPQDVPELIRSLSGQQPALVDLHVLPGQVLLSGRWATRNGWRRWKPWARGVPSAAFLRSGSAPAAFVPPAWLPADASLKLDFEIHEDGRRVREQIWRSALSPRRAQALAQRRLRDAGWRAARVPAARRSAGNGTTRHCNGPRPRWNRAAAYGSGAGHDENPVDAGVAPFWRLRAGAGGGPGHGLGGARTCRTRRARAGGGQRARCRTTGRGRGPGGGHAAGRIAPAATAGSRGLGAPCQPGSAGGASIAGRGAVSGYRCGRDHPAGTSAGPTRRAGVDGACGWHASRNARLECDRRRSRAVGWPAARGRQRRRLRILCPRRQAQRRSGAVGGGSCPSARRPTMARRTRRTPCWRSARDALRFVAARREAS